ncbi:coiled-coil domain-containing protein 181-like [Diretmus argenteus]
MSDVVCIKPQEEYEDDFEKDLDWLISEESRSEDQGPNYEDIEAEIDKELEDDEKVQGTKQKKKTQKEEKGSNKTESIEEEEERWPSPMEPLECESDRDSPSKLSPIARSPTPPPMLDDQTDEEKKYILEKIREANRELRDQKAPDMPRHRRLQFKDKLVDLVEYEQHGAPSMDRAKDAETESEVSGKLSELQISPREESRGEGSSGGSGRAGGGAGESSQGKEGRVLVEKDGKFDWVSLNEVESEGLLPPLANNYSDNSHSSHRPQEPSKIHSSSSSPRPLATSSFSHQGIEHLRVPKPPSQPRNRPNSANHSQRSSQRRGSSKRRVQSATETPFQATETPFQSIYGLSPQQKELLQKIQEKKDRLAREAELRKQEGEEQKRQENEIAFRAWLMRKQDQLQEEKRIQRAQEMEKMNSRKDPTDQDEAFRLWLQRKQEQQQRDRQLEEMKRLEQEGILRNREEGERVFKLWLKHKQAQKRAEQQAARERSRRLVLEERRARRMRDLLSAVKPFRFNDQWSYRF